jgi:membrane protein
MKKIKVLLKIALTAFRSWIDKDPFMQSAAIAYYAIFSMPGLLVMVIAISTLFFQREVITEHIFNQISSIMGADTATQVENIITTASKSNKSVLATIIGIITILVGATGVFAQLQSALNIIWEVKPKPGTGKAFLRLLRTRLFSFGLILTIGFLLLILLTITTILSAMSNWVMNFWTYQVPTIFYILNFIISLVVVMFLFALMFKFLPDAKIKWRQVWLGSVLTALLFIIGKTIIGFYLSKTNPGSAYGAAGSIVLILLWVSYSAMIFFYGAEFTKAYADKFTDKILEREAAAYKRRKILKSFIKTPFNKIKKWRKS